MNAETRQCQNCKQPFVIEPDDFSFYERMKVPPPTWCPGCRRQRRFVWRNERSLYKRKSDFSGKDIICLYNKESGFRVYDQKEWWSDEWDPLSYGRKYDFSRPFFVQFRELQKEVPRLSIFNQQCTNSDYTNQSYENKNCYLCFSVAKSEDSAYCTNINEVKQSFDILYTSKSELAYQSIDSSQVYNSSFIINSDNCIDSSFLFDCKNCQDCIGGVGLRNKRYVFWGDQLTKEKFEEARKQFDSGSFKEQEQTKKRFLEFALNFPREASRFKRCVNSTGDLLTDCKNVAEGFGSYDLEDCRYIARIYSCKDTGDSYGLGESELAHETIGNQGIYHVAFSNVTSDSRNVMYCDLCFNCEDCFGCVGLKKKQYCILNAQYTKEEYEALVPKVIEHMNAMPYVDSGGMTHTYGEFFPAEFSPFAYNETIAQEYFPLAKEEVKTRGGTWRDSDAREYVVSKQANDLPDRIKDVPPSITDETIGCVHGGSCHHQCTEAFRILPHELEFYRRMNLPLPRLCPNCRHYERLAQRNPLKLWKRKCQCMGTKSENLPAQAGGAYVNTGKHIHGETRCPNEFETSYAPDRPEIVYCEQCYQSEVV